MTSYPGENPPPSEGPADDTAASDSAGPGADAGEGTEPTQPVGYWEREAAERAREQEQQRPDPTTPYPQSGAVFNPTSGQSAPEWDSGSSQPYGQPAPPPYGQPGPPPYAQPGAQQPYAPYAQGAPYSPPPGGQSAPPGGVPGYPPYSFAPPRLDHPQSTLAMVLGIVGLAGGLLLCGLGLVVSPFAWALGRNAVKEIEASQGRLGGESQARSGQVLGIIGTVLLVLGLLVLVLVIVIAVASSTSTGGSSI